jgi:hypothetical protein
MLSPVAWGLSSPALVVPPSFSNRLMDLWSIGGAFVRGVIVQARPRRVRRSRQATSALHSAPCGGLSSHKAFADVQPVALWGVASGPCWTSGFLALLLTDRGNRRCHIVRCSVVHHVAALRHTMKCAGGQLLVQPRGMHGGVDDAIIRSGEEAHRNTQLSIKSAEHRRVRPANGGEHHDAAA